ncbi:hypothetical protein BDN67DRAFT_917822, partial [Paxillus ammoniavirescens]
RKLSMRHTLVLADNLFHFTLPSHKADQFGDGNSVLIKRTAHCNDTIAIMRRYITNRDSVFPYHPQLWLTAAGNVPTRSWFI